MASDTPSSARKVVVHLRATGDAPILKQAKYKIVLVIFGPDCPRTALGGYFHSVLAKG